MLIDLYVSGSTYWSPQVFSFQKRWERNPRRKGWKKNYFKMLENYFLSEDHILQNAAESTL